MFSGLHGAGAAVKMEAPEKRSEAAVRLTAEALALESRRRQRMYSEARRGYAAEQSSTVVLSDREGHGFSVVLDCAGCR